MSACNDSPKGAPASGRQEEVCAFFGGAISRKVYEVGKGSFR